MDKTKFSVRLVLEEVGVVVMLTVRVHKFLKDILPGIEVLDDYESWPNWYLCILYWSFDLLKRFETS